MRKGEENLTGRAEKMPDHDSDAILSELKSAYESITRLKNTSGHRKMTLEIERRIRRTISSPGR